MHHLVAGRRSAPEARSGTSTTTRSTSCRRSSTASASSRPRRSRAMSRAASTASACATALTAPTPPVAVRPSSIRCSARERSGTRAGRRSAPTPRSRLEPLQRRHLGALPRRDRSRASCTISPRAPRDAPRADQPLVRRSRRQRRVPARRPLGGGDPQHTAARSSRAPATATSTTRTRAGVPEAQSVNIRNRNYIDRRAGRHPGPRAPNGVLFAQGSPFRRARALRQGQPSALRLQLRRRRSSN